MKIRIILLAALLVGPALPAHARVTFGVVPAANTLIRSEAQAAGFAADLQRRLGEEVKIRLFNDEATLHNWLNRFREVDLAVLSQSYIQRQPAGEFFALAVDLRTGIPGAAPADPVVARQGLSPQVLVRLQHALYAMAADPAARELIGAPALQPAPGPAAVAGPAPAMPAARPQLKPAPPGPAAVAEAKIAPRAATPPKPSFSPPVPALKPKSSASPEQGALTKAEMEAKPPAQPPKPAKQAPAAVTGTGPVKAGQAEPRIRIEPRKNPPGKPARPPQPAVAPEPEPAPENRAPVEAVSRAAGEKETTQKAAAAEAIQAAGTASRFPLTGLAAMVAFALAGMLLFLLRLRQKRASEAFAWHPTAPGQATLYPNSRRAAAGPAIRVARRTETSGNQEARAAADRVIAAAVLSRSAKSPRSDSQGEALPPKPSTIPGPARSEVELPVEMNEPRLPLMEPLGSQEDPSRSPTAAPVPGAFRHVAPDGEVLNDCENPFLDHCTEETPDLGALAEAELPGQQEGKDRQSPTEDPVAAALAAAAAVEDPQQGPEKTPEQEMAPEVEVPAFQVPGEALQELYTAQDPPALHLDELAGAPPEAAARAGAEEEAAEEEHPADMPQAGQEPDSAIDLSASDEPFILETQGEEYACQEPGEPAVALTEERPSLQVEQVPAPAAGEPEEAPSPASPGEVPADTPVVAEEAAPAPLNLEGTVAAIQMPALLQLVATQARPGSLLITTPHDEKRLHFRNGRIALASSVNRANRHKTGFLMNKVGYLLIRQGKITEKQRDEALEFCSRHPSRRIGETLVEMGALSREELLEALRNQAESVIFSLFIFPEGHFQFVFEAFPLHPEDDLALDIEELLDKARRSEPEWDNIRQGIPSLNAILDYTPNGRSKLGSARMTVHQKLVLSLIDGKRQINDICVAATMLDLEVYKFLYFMVHAKILQPVGQD